MMSGFEILEDGNLINKDWLLLRLFENIFHHLKFAEEHKKQFL